MATLKEVAQVAVEARRDKGSGFGEAPARDRAHPAAASRAVGPHAGKGDQLA